jgi:hypothetical protein
VIVAQIPGRPSLGEAQARGTYVGTVGQKRGQRHERRNGEGADNLGGSTTDSRFSSVSPEVTRLLSQQQQLQAELKAATSENVSLRETLSGTSTTTTGTTTTKTP